MNPTTALRATLAYVLILGLGGQAATAALITNFEAGAADYDNVAIQTTGKFRDTNNGTVINLTANGAGNDFLNFSPGIGTSAATVYDTTPGTSPIDRFLVPVGGSATFIADAFVTSVSGQRTEFRLGLFDPDATTTDKGISLSVNMRPGFGGAITLDSVLNSNGDVGGEADIELTTLNNNPLRLYLTLVNNGTSADITGQVFLTSGLGGTLGSQVASDLTTTLNFGLGAGEYDLDPAAAGLGLVFFAQHQGSAASVLTSLDDLNVLITVPPQPIPEPSGFVLVMLGMTTLATRRSLTIRK